MTDLAVVLFDLDGVLVDTRSLVEQAYLDVARYLGVKTPSEEALKRATEVRPQRALSELFGEDNSKANTAFNRYWRDNINSVSCFTGIMELLRSLTSLEIILGTVTSRNAADTFSLLGAAGIRTYMQVIVTWGHYRAAKPSPACLVVALRKTGKPPSKTAYVGDQAVDILAARRAGILAVGAIWDANASEEDLRGAGATVIVREPKEILAMVGRRQCGGHVRCDC